VFAILLWTFGLSHRASSLVLSGLNVLVSFMTIWRDVQAEVQQMKKCNLWKPVRILDLDGAYVLGWGEKRRCWWQMIWELRRPLQLGTSMSMIRKRFVAS
jgi:hypothetical protein